MATKVRAERKKKKIQTVTQKYRSFLALNLRGQVKGDSLTEVSGRLTAEGDDRSCQSCQQTSFTLNTWSLQSSSAGQDPSPSPVCPSEWAAGGASNPCGWKKLPLLFSMTARHIRLTVRLGGIRPWMTATWWMRRCQLLFGGGTKRNPRTWSSHSDYIWFSISFLLCKLLLLRQRTVWTRGLLSKLVKTVRTQLLYRIKPWSLFVLTCLSVHCAGK